VPGAAISGPNHNYNIIGFFSFSSLGFSQVGADTLLKVAGVEVGHFTNLSAASLNNLANFAGLLAA